MKRSPFIKWLGQDGKFHEAWCDVFEGGDCNCNDDDHKKPRRREPGPLSDAPSAKKHLEKAS